MFVDHVFPWSSDWSFFFGTAVAYFGGASMTSEKTGGKAQVLANFPCSGDFHRLRFFFVLSGGVRPRFFFVFCGGEGERAFLA